MNMNVNALYRVTVYSCLRLVKLARFEGIIPVRLLTDKCLLKMSVKVDSS